MSNIYKPLAVVALEAASRRDQSPYATIRDAETLLKWLKENVPDDERPWAP